MSNNNTMDIWSFMGNAIPEELRPKKVEEPKTKKGGKGASITKTTKSSTTKKEVIIYVPLPIEIVSNFEKISRTIDDFDESEIVYLVEKDKKPDAKEEKKEKENEEQKEFDLNDIDSDEENTDSDGEDTDSDEEKTSNSSKEDTQVRDAYLYDESIPKVSLEILRKSLEKDYPWFTKERTKMNYDKKLGVVDAFTYSGAKA